jgi:uncharacterized protein YceK
MRNRQFIRIVTVFLASVLLLSGCNHMAMVEMQKSAARERYYEHGDRMQYEEEIREIDQRSDEWEVEQKRNKQSEFE